MQAHQQPQQMQTQQMVQMIQGHINPYTIARAGFVDEIIDPRETRKVLMAGLQMSKDKVVERPWRRHGVLP